APLTGSGVALADQHSAEQSHRPHQHARRHSRHGPVVRPANRSLAVRRGRYHYVALSLLAVGARSCVSGATDRGDLVALVQRIALFPGADALDALDPTPVGTDWTRIDFYLIESLTAQTRATFDPKFNLEMDGLGIQ